jgi:hypothetical protein
MKSTTKLFLTLLGVIAFVGGAATSFALSAPDPCRDFAAVSRDAMTINTTILDSTTAFLKADTAGDSVGMISASNDLTKATDDLEALRSRYDSASRKCHV